MEQTINYKGYDIEISKDEFAQNPYDDMDLLLSIDTKSHIARYEKTYGDDSPVQWLIDHIDYETVKKNFKFFTNMLGFKFPTDYQLQKAIMLEYFFQYDDDVSIKENFVEWHEYQYEAFVEAIHEYITDYPSGYNQNSFSNAYEVATHLGYICDYDTLRGYSQGDWCEVFAILTPETMEKWGSKDYTKKDITSGFELLSSWLWGDVYYYTIDVSGGGCGGFYGDNHRASGLLELAENEIDCHIKYQLKKRIEKLKELLKNKVPLEKRSALIEQKEEYKMLNLEKIEPKLTPAQVEELAEYLEFRTNGDTNVDLDTDNFSIWINDFLRVPE